MKTMQLLACVILSCIILNACNSKEDTTNPTTAQIDVSRQWKFDNTGLFISGYSDGQWTSAAFSTEELNLFNSLDTASLTATTTPISVLPSTGGSYYSIFPNPFSVQHNLPFSFSPGYTGQFVLKVVYVDSLGNPIYKNSVKLQAVAPPAPNPAYAIVALRPTIPTGRFRLYYTLSSAADRHFFKCWGNVQQQ